MVSDYSRALGLMAAGLTIDDMALARDAERLYRPAYGPTNAQLKKRAAIQKRRANNKSNRKQGRKLG